MSRLDHPAFGQETCNPRLLAAAKVGLVWGPLGMKLMAELTQATSSLQQLLCRLCSPPELVQLPEHLPLPCPSSFPLFLLFFLPSSVPSPFSSPSLFPLSSLVSQLTLGMCCGPTLLPLQLKDHGSEGN